MDDFPGNSRNPRGDQAPAQEPKVIPRVVTGDVTRRKKSVGGRFRETFGGTDARSAAGHVFMEVVVPSVKQMLVNSGQQWLQRLILGEVQNNYGPPGIYRTVANHVNYAAKSNTYVPQQNASWRPAAQQGGPVARTVGRHFDDLILASAGEATQVIDLMQEVLGKYDVVTVADLYEMVGVTDGTHLDHKWGWNSLRGAGVTPANGGGYILNLPKPSPIE